MRHRQLFPIVLACVWTGTSVLTLHAQSDSLQIKAAALAAYAAHYKAGIQPPNSPRQLIFNPTVVRAWYDGTIHPLAGPITMAARDSSELATLAAALGGIAIPLAEAAGCTGKAILPVTCAMGQSNSIIVTTSEPSIRGDSATILMRTAVPSPMSDGTLSTARSVSTWLVRLTRSESRWIARCVALVATDAPVGEVCRP